MIIHRIAILSFAAIVGLAPHTASAELLAGFHKFDTVTGVGYEKTGADKGTFAANATISYDTGSTNTGGSTDNWYGPDGTNVYDGTNTGVVGGHITNQTPFAANTTNPLYVFETTGPADPRLNPVFGINAPTPPNMIDGNDSTGDGRINGFNGTDITMTNVTSQVYRLDSFVFDAFVGGVTDPAAFVNIEDFVLVYQGFDGSTFSQAIGVSAGYAGYHSQTGEGLNSPLLNPLIVNNQIDYGIGMNYFDYVVNLDGLIMNPGDSVSIGLNSTANSGMARGDNFAFFGTAVPEPSSVLAIAAVLGLGVWKRRRKLQAQSCLAST